ncbi:MAG: hypothetical protein AB7V08_01985 [Elusimicrobiales bacterium]
MNFFRLRALNTFLLFFIGIILGFILKDKFYPSRPPAHPASFQTPYSPQPPAQAADGEGEESDEPEAPPDLEPEAEEPAPPLPAPVIAPAAPRPAEIVMEEAPRSESRALRGEEDGFFARPERYEGRDLEMQLQMITAKRVPSGWRLNLVYSGRGKEIDYLYVEDSGVLGAKPDLRIGYVYKVRFRCGKGSSAAGNTLLAIEPTGAKADWATGLSATE